MFTLTNGEQSYRITFQHHPTRTERLEYAEKRDAAIAEGKPIPRPPREHRRTVCRVYALDPNPDPKTPTMVNSTLIGEGVVRQWPTDEYNKETARRQSLGKALFDAFPGSESDSPVSRQIRIQAWAEYWRVRQEALATPVPFDLSELAHLLHSHFNGPRPDENMERLSQLSEILYGVFHGPHTHEKESDNDDTPEPAVAVE